MLVAFNSQGCCAGIACSQIPAFLFAVNVQMRPIFHHPSLSDTFHFLHLNPNQSFAFYISLSHQVCMIKRVLIVLSPSN